MSSGLDISWIEETNRMYSLDQNPLREPCTQIKTFFVFMNRKNSVSGVVSVSESGDSGDSGDSSSIRDGDTIVNVITKMIDIPSSGVLNKNHCLRECGANTKGYSLKDVLLFHVPFEPEQIPLYNCGKLKEPTLLTMNLEDIVIPPSIFVFHNVHSLYFFLSEEQAEPLKPRKSILKTGGRPLLLGKTKKVVIQVPENNFLNHRKTKRK